MFAVLTQSSKISNLDKLLGTLEKFWVCKPDIYVMNFTEEEIPKHDLNIYEIRENKLVPLSVARNKLIERFNLIGNSEYSHFVFLDDDCWFEEKFDSRCMERGENYIGFARSPSGTLLHSLNLFEFTCAISINMIIAAKFLDYFDEKLGLGSEIGTGEDWGYYLLASSRQNFSLAQTYSVVHLAFKDKIKTLSFSQIRTKGKSEALAVRYLEEKYHIRTYRIVVRSFLKSVFPFYGIRFMLKNISFLIHYVR